MINRILNFFIYSAAELEVQRKTKIMHGLIELANELRAKREALLLEKRLCKDRAERVRYFMAIQTLDVQLARVKRLISTAELDITILRLQDRLDRYRRT